ncbi:hypothetical protein ACUN0C_18680 [Faunimonas sp. B44]|uniref:hypothetical protein n=1 Tax=Faunimonas sp. B44 TaxID=3461493 RepID=UPI004043BDE7
MLIGNRQEAFDFVVRHLFKKGRPAMNQEGDCLYRAPDGTKCAVGCLIPDHLYDRSLEDNSVRFLPRKILDQLPDVNLLGDLQDVHDSAWSTRATLRDRLSVVADKFDLNTDALEEAFNNATW